MTHPLPIWEGTLLPWLLGTRGVKEATTRSSSGEAEGDVYLLPREERHPLYQTPPRRPRVRVHLNGSLQQSKLPGTCEAQEPTSSTRQTRSYQRSQSTLLGSQGLLFPLMVQRRELHKGLAGHLHVSILRGKRGPNLLCKYLKPRREALRHVVGGQHRLARGWGAVGVGWAEVGACGGSSLLQEL